jgi:hypothetical protein
MGKLKSAKLSKEINMFWVKEYCKKFDLELAGINIKKDNKVIATIDYYDDIIFFLNSKTKHPISHLAHATIEDCKLH